MLSLMVKQSLLFQQMSIIAVFQNIHLMNGDFVKFFQSVALWNAFVNQDRVDIFHIWYAYKLIYGGIVSDVTFRLRIVFSPFFGLDSL